MTVVLVALAAILLAVVLLNSGGGGPAAATTRERAYHELRACLVDRNGGPACYDLPIVRAATRAGWDAPSYYQIVEGNGYHE